MPWIELIHCDMRRANLWWKIGCHSSQFCSFDVDRAARMEERENMKNLWFRGKWCYFNCLFFFSNFSWCPKVDVKRLISNTHESFSTFKEFPHPQNPFRPMPLLATHGLTACSTVHGCEPTVDHPGTLLRSDEFGSKKARTMQ